MKLNRYNGFILESTFYDLLLESQLKYMTDFKSLLNDMKDDYYDDKSITKIVNFLLKILNKDMKLTQNFIGVDEVDKVSFIPDNKVDWNSQYVSIDVNDRGRLQQIVARHSILDTLNVPKEGLHHPDELSEIPSNRWKVVQSWKGIEAGVEFSRYTLHLLQNMDDEGYFVVVCDDTSKDAVGYIPHYEVPENLRGSIKIGRFINKILDIWFKDKISETEKRSDYTAADIEKFVNAYSAKVFFMKNEFNFFEIVKGEDIRKWYLVDNYASDNGQLGASCLRY